MFFISTIIYRILLDYIYIYIVSPVYSYQGFTLNQNFNSILVSWIILFFISFFVVRYWNSKKEDYFIVCVTLIFFYLRVVPLTSFLANNFSGSSFAISALIFWFLFYLFLGIVKIPTLKMPKTSLSIMPFLTFIFVVVVVFISGYYTHFRLNFDLFNVYDLRLEARDFKMPIFLSYLWPAAANILPLILVYYLSKKKYGLVSFLAFVIFLNFSINGLKSVLFKLIIAILLYLFWKDNFIKYIVVCLILLFSFSLFEFYVLESSVISTLIVRRVFFMPSMLDTLFYDYFTIKGPIYYSEAVDVNFAISEFYFGKEEMRANNGLFSDAIINLGYCGIVLYPILYSVFFKYCSAAFTGLSKFVVVFVAFIIAMSLNSTMFTTALLTHGIFLLCLVVYLLPRDYKGYSNRKI